MPFGAQIQNSGPEFRIPVRNSEMPVRNLEIQNSESGRFRISTRQNALWGTNSYFWSTIQNFGLNFRFSFWNSEITVRDPVIQKSESGRCRIPIRQFALWDPNSEF